jgi:hypothetical protein
MCNARFVEEQIRFDFDRQGDKHAQENPHRRSSKGEGDASLKPHLFVASLGSRKTSPWSAAAINLHSQVSL